MPDTLEPVLEAALDPKALQAAWKAFGKHAFYGEHLVAGIRAYLAAASPQAEIARLREALADARAELFEAEDKFWVAHCNFPVSTKDSFVKERQRQDKDFLAKMSERMKAARERIGVILHPETPNGGQ